MPALLKMLWDEQAAIPQQYFFWAAVYIPT